MGVKLITHLQKPYPLEKTPKFVIFNFLAIGLFVSLFLLIFQPFGSSVYIQEGRSWVLWVYGLIAGLVLLFNLLLLPRMFPRFFNESKWNIIKQICFMFWHIISIGISNLIFSHIITERELSLFSVVRFIFEALAIGFFPIIISVFSMNNYYLKKYITSTKTMNKKIASFSSTNQKEKEAEELPGIVLTSETGKEEIVVNLNNLLFIKSIENYIEVYLAEGDKIKSTLMRNSLKRIEDNLQDFSYIFRCHRTYLVNVYHIHKVTGNSHGYKLIFNGFDYPIPVSRSNSEKFKKLVTKILDY